MKIEHANKLIDFISKSSCNFLAIENIKKRLINEGFLELKQNEKWSLEPNGKYFIVKNKSSLISFNIGEDVFENGFKIIVSHVDSPGFMIKPNCEIKSLDNFLLLNTEGYGGMILYSWLDRPLSISGRVTLKGKNIFNPIEKTIDFKKPLLIIPSLAIHLNRQINEGFKFNKQKHMLPIMSLVEDNFKKDGLFLKLISDELNINKDEILDYELFLYEYGKGDIIGLNNEFISSSRLDDLMMVYNSLEAFITASKEQNLKGINVAFFADNEEVGSKTPQGADSSLMKDILERIANNLFKEEDAFHRILGKSFAISADLGHSVHPAYVEKHDITNLNLMGKGMCLKYSANQRYATNAFSSGVFISICEEAGVQVSKYVNNSEVVGGSTIGPILASELNIPVVDVGCSILGMHAVRELASVDDNLDAYKVFCKFYI